MCKKIIKKIVTIFMIICMLLFIFSSFTGITYGYSGPKLGAGEEAEIDEELKDILYSAQYESITALTTDSSVALQGKVHTLWLEQGSQVDSHNWAYVTIGGQNYYLIATGQFFGTVCDYLILNLQNGDSYPCIMADAKGEETYEQALEHNWPNYAYYDSEGRHLGHWYYKQEKLDIIEIVVGSSEGWKAGSDVSLNELGQVESIINGGSYEDYPDGPVGADGITYTLTKGTTSSSGSTSFADKFKQNAVGAVISLILDGLRTLGDGIQMIINAIQNSTLHIGIKMMYTYDDLIDDITPEEFCEANGIDSSYIDADELDSGASLEEILAFAKVKNRIKNGAGNLNSYTNVGGYVSGGSSASDIKEGQIGVDVTDSYFKTDTKIPVITVDYYNFAVNNISFLDVNYLTGYNDHDDGSPWMIIRNFAAAFINMIMYVAAILLIAMLIVQGISLVTFSMAGKDNPKKQLDHKKGMNKFITAVCMLVGTVLITSLCIFGVQELCEIIAVDSVNSSSSDSKFEYELPVRVHVSSAGYSFSTNFTGYARYMTQIDDVDAYTTKAIYTFVYLVFVVMNVIGLGFMLFRLFALYVLAVYGPITVIMYMFSKDDEPGKIPRSYKNWAILYCMICATQLIFAISYRAVLYWIAD